jgi:peptidoglycan/xylan/chitin deacetylase (PgdA/CDA1 family)/glycosyltransferase involved in cell wall biosynthesis
MKILHVLSQFEVTGAEAYAAALIDEQVRAGHSAIVISDTLTLPVNAIYIPMPIGRRSYPQRLKNIVAIVRLVREESIDIIHAHSRAASWVSLVACRLTHTPLVSTVHGRQHIHASSKAFSVYGKDVVAVSPALKEHLVRDLGLRTEDVSVIPNCIPITPWKAAKYSGKRKTRNLIMFVGRLTGPKGDVVRFLLTKVLPIILRKKQVRFEALGGMIVPPDIPNLVASINAQHRQPIIQLKGFQQDIPGHLSESSLIIGSGRVVPESMVLERPVIAFGESSYEGRVTAENYDKATVTNFGDTGVPMTPEADRVAADILALLKDPPSKKELASLARLAEKRYDARNVARTLHQVYERAFARSHSPQSIPVLMYHRITTKQATASSHGIWVTAEQFETQLHSLRRRGFETITFADYDRFLKGNGRLPRRPIILTFDDGYEDNYTTALPLLQKHSCRAVIFAVADKKRRTNFWDSGEPTAALLTAVQMRELHHAGIEIGSHTVTHPRLPETPVGVMRRELSESKDSLQQILGSEVISFAYPYGALQPATKSLVEEADYRFAVAADSGPLTFYQDFLEIRRTQVFPWTTRTGFWKKTLPLYNQYKSLKS